MRSVKQRHLSWSSPAKSWPHRLAASQPLPAGGCGCCMLLRGWWIAARLCGRSGWVVWSKLWKHLGASSRLVRIWYVPSKQQISGMSHHRHFKGMITLGVTALQTSHKLHYTITVALFIVQVVTNRLLFLTPGSFTHSHTSCQVLAIQMVPGKPAFEDFQKIPRVTGHGNQEGIRRDQPSA